jgi:hypothetical protein
MSKSRDPSRSPEKEEYYNINNIDEFAIYEVYDSESKEKEEAEQQGEEASESNKSDLQSNNNISNPGASYINPRGRGKLLPCNSCGVDVEYKNNKLIRCTVCFNTTHQTCYGGEIWSLPKQKKSNFTCQRCLDSQTDTRTKRCFICKQSTGIMRKVSAALYSHMDCIGWNKYVEYYITEM